VALTLASEVARPPAYERLLDQLGEVYDLSRTATLLGWDELCMMPKGGAESRADQKATLERLVHARFTSDEVGGLFEELKPWADNLDYDSTEASLVRVGYRNYLRYRLIPPRLVVEMSRAASRGYHAWLEARAANDYAVWRPAHATVVRRLIELTEALGYAERRYDALLERREPGIRTSQVEALFDQLRVDLVPFAQRIAERADVVDDAVLHQEFDVDAQRALGLEVIRAIGFDFQRGRVDHAVHPISYSISPDDVRLATRVNPTFFSASFFSCLHEAGHGLYFQGVPRAFRRTPLDGTTAQGANLTPVYGGISTGLHEGQSRLWENVLGRSRAFWEFFFPRVEATFPEQTRGVGAAQWYRAVNRSRPSLIRVEADELTYDLHIMLRFELESGLLEERISVDDLPDAWDQLSERYLGLRPPDHLQGVLQDLQWSRGGHGGFPSYTIGNVISMQLWELMERDVPDLDDRFRQGDLLVLRDWMREHLHQHGSKYEPLEVVRRLTGRAELNPEAYVRYLKRKFGEVYGV
jgi:carboxypeptidase Taq